MPDQLQLRGGTTAEHSTFTGASKEVTIDTTKKTAVVHDASTAGGNPLMREDGANSALVNGSVTEPALAFAAGDADNGIYSPGTDQVAITTNGVERVEWGASEVVFNDGGENYDFRVEGDTQANLLFVDASTDRIGVGTAAPINALHINGAAGAVSSRLRLSSTEGSGFTIRSESATETMLNVDSSEHLLFGVGGGEVARIDSSGNLGIGTGLPAAVLTTVPTASFSPADVTDFSGVGLFLQSTTGIAGDGNYGSALAWSRPSDGTRFKTAIAPVQEGGDQDVQGLAFFTANSTGANDSPTERVRIDSSGNVGIGTTGPAARLDVAVPRAATVDTAIFGTTGTGSANDVARILIKNVNSLGGQNQGVGIGGVYATDGTNDAHLAFYSNSGGLQERVRIDSSGDVGIGTTTPDFKLHVVSTDTAALKLKRSGAGGGVNLRLENGDSNTFDIAYDGAERLKFTAGTAERLRIDSDGVISTSSAIGETFYANTNTDLRVFTGSGSDAGGVSIESTCDNTSARYHIAFSNPNGVVGSISTNASATSYTTSSDYRLKENIIAVTDGITRLKQLKPSRFNFIADPDKTVDGFIAHEAAVVVPEAVTGEKDAVQVWEEGEIMPEGVSVGDNKLDDNNNTIPVYQGIDQSKLVPLLTAALQEAVAKIEVLEAKVAALEAN